MDENSQTEFPLSMEGRHPERVIRLIKDRANSQGSQITSERRLVIVAEGGAMRGVVSAGVLSALAIMGAQDAFNAIYSTSAAVINSAHFLSGKGLENAATYHKHLSDHRFFDPKRLLRAVDINYVTDTVLKKLSPLDCAGFCKSTTPLYSTFYSKAQNKTICLKIPNNQDQIFDYLNAAISIPVVARSKRKINGDTLSDGALQAPIPIDFALASQPTDILVILSSSPYQAGTKTRLWQKILFFLFFAKGNRSIYQNLEKRKKAHARMLDLCLQKNGVNSPNLNIATIFPKESRISSLERDSIKLRNALAAYTHGTLRLFGAEEHSSQIDDLVDSGVF